VPGVMRCICATRQLLLAGRVVVVYEDAARGMRARVKVLKKRYMLSNWGENIKAG